MIDFTKREDALLGEVLYCGVHESGTRVYIMPKKGYKKCHAMFATRYGSLESEFLKGEKKVKIPDGTAHFLEHKLFEEPDGNVFDKFSVLGASANAFTNFTATAYHFSATSNFYESLAVLINFVQNPYFTKESIDKEQGIIGQEIKMYDDDPNWRVYFNVLGCLYNECYVKYDIAGTVESISEIDKDILYDIYSVFYHPSNMVLYIIGDVDIEKTCAVVCENLRLGEPLSEPIRRLYPKEAKEIADSYVCQHLDVAVPLFTLGFKDTDIELRGDALLKKEIEMKILIEILFSRRSPIYKTLYEKGLINDTFDAGYECHEEYAFSCLTGESKNPHEVRSIVYDMLPGLKIDEAEYERAKKVVWGNYVRLFNSTEAIGYGFALHCLAGMDYFNFRKVYDTVTADDVRRRKQLGFDIKKSALSVVTGQNS